MGHLVVSDEVQQAITKIAKAKGQKIGICADRLLRQNQEVIKKLRENTNATS